MKISQKTLKKTFKIKTLKQIKAVSQPLRRRLLELFCTKTLTAKQAAIELGENPTKLYHHVEVLKNVGVIRLVKTKQNRGTTEKYYTAVATDFKIDDSLFGSEVGDKVANEFYGLIKGELDDALKGVRESFENDTESLPRPHNSVTLTNLNVYTNKEKVKDLIGVIKSWVAENCDAEAEENDLHHITMVTYPTVETEE